MSEDSRKSIEILWQEVQNGSHAAVVSQSAVCKG